MMLLQGHTPMESTPRTLVKELFVCQYILDHPSSSRLFSHEHYSWSVAQIRTYYGHRMEQLRRWLRSEQEVAR